MWRLWVWVLAVALFAAVPAAAQIPYFTGPQDVSQMQNMFNQLIREINSQTASEAAAAWPVPASAFGFVAGADNSVAMAALMASTSNPTVAFPAGTFEIGCPAATLSAASNISIVGAGRGITIIKTTAACALPSGSLWLWQNGSHGAETGASVTLADFSLRLPTATSGSLRSVIALVGHSDTTVRGVEISGAPTLVNLLSVSAGAAGSARVKLSSNYLSLAAAATTQNQCVLVSSTGGGVVSDIFITGNTCVNSAMDIDAARPFVAGNDISGWGYGAGVTVEATANSHDAVIVGNNLHDSNQALDGGGYAPGGVEVWAPRSVISLNKCTTLYGACIDNGSLKGVLTGNLAYGVGLRGLGANTAAFASRYQDATYNASGSTYTGNEAYDDGSASLKYGYSEESSSLTGLTVTGSSFCGANTAVHLVSVSPVVDSVSRCAAFAHTTKSVAAPNSTGNGTAVMLGLAGTVTPAVTGTVRFAVTGTINNNTIGDGCQLQIRTGTGSAPANGDAAAGTTRGSTRDFIASTAAGKVSFANEWTVTGLTVGTAYWIDLGFNAVTGGTCVVTNADVIADELL